jgi:hypothetical protein
LRGLKNEPTVTGLPSRMSSKPDQIAACTKMPKMNVTICRMNSPPASRPAEKDAPYSPSVLVLAEAPPSTTNTRDCTTTKRTRYTRAARISGPTFLVNLFHAQPNAWPMSKPDPGGGPYPGGAG